MRNPPGQGGRLRMELIAAADRILAQTGDVESLSLRGVAREVGIATPSIYLHFPEKSALVRAVLTVRFAELEAAVRTAAAAANGPADQMRAGCLAYCHFATEHPNAYRVLFGRRPAKASVEQVSRDDLAAAAQRGSLTLPADGAPVGAEAFSFLVNGITRCIEAGLAPPAEPLRVAMNIWTSLHGIVTLRALVPGFPWPPLHEQVNDSLCGLVGLHGPAHCHNPAPALPAYSE